MKKIALAMTLALAALGAQAQTFVQVDPANPKPLRFVAGAGLTFGGEKLATAHFVDGHDVDLRAGGFVALLAGVDYRVSPQFSAQATVGYHIDDATGDNGDMRFARVPFELLGYYHVNDKVRVGGGIRHVTHTEFRTGGVVADMGDFEFEDTTSGVVELEYMYSQQLGLKVRWVNDKFKEKTYGIPLKGEHVGLLANFYF
jgi:hypothetical protein